MSCLLVIASVCFLDPAHVEVKADFSYRVAGDFTYHTEHTNYGGGHLFTGEIAQVVELSSRLDMRYGLRHESMYDVKDSANRRWFVGFSWRPFYQE